MKMRLHVQVYGLGYSQVEVSLPAYGIQLRYLVCSTPTDQGWIELRGAVSMQRITKPQQIHPLLVLIPRALVNKLTARMGYTGFVNDLQQDFKIWEHKRYVHPPALAAGDGPIGKYCAWARQF